MRRQPSDCAMGINQPNWDNEPKKPPSRHIYPKHETEWISTPGGDIDLGNTVKFLSQYILNSPNPSNDRPIINCPKCGAASLHVEKKFWGRITKIYASRVQIGVYGKKELNINAFETHMENGKDIIAICLNCNHNRTPLSSFATEKNIEIKKEFDPRDRTIYCVKCFSTQRSIHDKQSGKDLNITSFWQITDLQNVFLRCTDCGHEQDFPVD